MAQIPKVRLVENPYTLPETSSSPLKIGRNPIGKDFSFQTSIFYGRKCWLRFREGKPICRDFAIYFSTVDVDIPPQSRVDIAGLIKGNRNQAQLSPDHKAGDFRGMLGRVG